MNPPNASVPDSTLNMARRTCYRYAAIALTDPRLGSWHELADVHSQRLVAAAAELLRQEPAAVAQSLALGELPLASLHADRMCECLPGSPEKLNAAYERVFGLLVSGSCPPYETEYIDGKLTFQRSQELADIAGFYHAFGLETATPERQDHVALELEFMASLLGLENGALQSGSAESYDRLAVCRKAQSKFLHEHLAWWVPTFGKLLTIQDSAGFYGAVGRFLAALIAAERAILGVPTPRVPVGPSALERPEECESCQLGPGGADCVTEVALPGYSHEYRRKSGADS